MRPWMSETEEKIIKQALHQLVANLSEGETLQCLEWGSGGSTLTFPYMLAQEFPHLPFNWWALEHDSQWAEELSEKMASIYGAPGKALLPDYQQVKLYDFERTRGQLHPPPEVDMSVYINFPSHISTHELGTHPYSRDFHFILVDGRRRAECISRQGAHILADGGVLFLHDCHRPYYRKGIETFLALPNHYGTFLTPPNETGGFGLWRGDRE